MTDLAGFSIGQRGRLDLVPSELSNRFFCDGVLFARVPRIDINTRSHLSALKYVGCETKPVRLFLHVLELFGDAELIGDGEGRGHCAQLPSAENGNMHKTANRRSDSDFIGAINPSNSPHNFVKDWRLIRKFCLHPGSENSQTPNLSRESTLPLRARRLHIIVETTVQKR